MKYMILFLFSVGCFTSAFGQDTITHRYKSGETASMEILENRNKPDRKPFSDEKVLVFNRKGDVIFDGRRRDYAGHSSVYLTYHKNGGVSRIETSTAPDAGIQWYRSQYSIDEDGKVIDFREQSNENLTKITVPTVQPEKPMVKPKTLPTKTQLPNECAVLTETKIIFCNKRKKAINCLLVPVVKNDGHKIISQKLGFNDTLATPAYHTAEKFLNPAEFYDLYIQTRKGEDMQKVEWSEVALKVLQKDAQHRVYLFYWVD